jgi:hypothetical protein
VTLRCLFDEGFPGRVRGTCANRKLLHQGISVVKVKINETSRVTASLASAAKVFDKTPLDPTPLVAYRFIPAPFTPPTASLTDELRLTVNPTPSDRGVRINGKIGHPCPGIVLPKWRTQKAELPVFQVPQFPVDSSLIRDVSPTFPACSCHRTGGGQSEKPRLYGPRAAFATMFSGQRPRSFTASAPRAKPCSSR